MQNKIKKLIYGTGGAFGYQSLDKACKIVEYLINEGVYKFDTGSNYANFRAEKLLGECFKEIKIDTNKLELYSKFGTIYSTNKRKYIKNFTINNCLKTLDNSLKNLGKTKLDCFYMHEPNIDFKENEKIIIELENLKETGVIKNWGVLAHNYNLIDSINEKWEINPDHIMLKLNLGNYVKQINNLKRLNKKGIKIIAGTVLSQGALIPSYKDKLIFKNELFYILRRFLKKESFMDYYKNRNIFYSINAKSSVLSSFAAIAFIKRLVEVEAISFSSLREKGIREVIDMTSINLTEKQISYIYSVLLKYN